MLPQPVIGAEALNLLATMPSADAAAIPTPAALTVPQRLLLRPNPRCVGRATELPMIARQRKAGGTMVISTGTGEIGKPRRAVAFAHRYGNGCAGGVFWRSFAQLANIALEIAAGAPLDALTLRPAYASLSLEAHVAGVQRYRPTSGGCRVLVTSRRAAWDVTLGVIPLPLDLLDPAAAGHLLHRLNDTLSAARMRHRRWPRSKVRRPDLLQHPSLTGRGQQISPTAHELHVAKTFALSLQRLDPGDSIAALARAACLASGTPVPREVLIATLERDPTDAAALLAVSDALERLLNLGLLEAKPSDGLRLHRLLALFAAEALNDANARPAVAHVLIHAADHRNATGYPSAMQPIAPHLHHCTVRAQDRDDAQAAARCTHVAQPLAALGDYVVARTYDKRACAITEQTRGPAHPHTATSHTKLAGLLKTMGDDAAACPRSERARAVCEATHGPSPPHTAPCRTPLARHSYYQGQLPQAAEVRRRTLAIYKQQLGAHHPETQDSRQSLAVIEQELAERKHGGTGARWNAARNTRSAGRRGTAGMRGAWSALGKPNRETRKQKGSAITLSAALFQLSTFSFQLSL